jgi:hypothetical protein
MGVFGLGALWKTYLRLLEVHPLPTKVITSASINGVGDILGQTLFEKDKPFDFLRLAKFTLLVRMRSAVCRARMQDIHVHSTMKCLVPSSCL